MALFPKELGTEDLSGAPRRMAWTRERGTSRLLLLLLSLLTIWFVVGRVQDHFLLQKKWPLLQPDATGLTIVGTLDARDAYERNMFKIVQANKTSRAELTDYGWRTIFDSKNGPEFSERKGGAIRQAISLNGETGYAMMEPYLRAGVKIIMGLPNPRADVSPALPITTHDLIQGRTVTEQTTLGALLNKYSPEGGAGEGEAAADSGEGSGGSGREVEHGLTIPGENLMQACPVVLNSDHFTDAWVEERPGSVFQGKTFMVHLGLNAEGRSRFYQWSRDHANESLVFILNGKVATAGRIRQTLNVSEWEVGPLRDEAAARELEKFVNDHAKKAVSRT